jgi:ferredoxin-NADP reductase
MEHQIEILHTGFVTHDVKQFITTCPEGFEYEPGQGVELAVDEDGWRDEGRPFTPTAPAARRVLEFTIKGYPDHEGVTEKLHALVPGDGLLMSGPFGTITYQGPGTFIAGGAGVTPFLAILRKLGQGDELDRCSLLFSNRTPADVICEKELRHLRGDRCRLVFTREAAPGFEPGQIDRRRLEKEAPDLDRPFYVCGPPEMVDEVREALLEMGAGPERIVVEE